MNCKEKIKEINERENDEPINCRKIAKRINDNTAQLKIYFNLCF